jgi:hypothetical protein
MNFFAFPASAGPGYPFQFLIPIKNRDSGIFTAIPNAGAKIQIKIYIFGTHITICKKYTNL